MTIKITELNTATLNQLSEQELNQVVGGFLSVIDLYKFDQKLSLTEKSYIGQAANNNSNIFQLGGGLASVATVQQLASNMIA